MNGRYTRWQDEELKKIILDYDINHLLEKYYQNFIKLINSRLQIDSITRVGNKIRFSFPLDDKTEFKLWNLYTQFIKQSWETEKNHMEIIPLDINTINDDMITRIVKEKRNINLVKNSSEIDPELGSNEGYLNQYFVDYSDEDEHTDIVLLLKYNKFNELKNKYLKKLKLVYWW